MLAQMDYRTFPVQEGMRKCTVLASPHGVGADRAFPVRESRTENARKTEQLASCSAS
jgi:hypothetical protein